MKYGTRCIIRRQPQIYLGVKVIEYAPALGSSNSLFILISAPAKEKRFAVYYKYEEDRVEDGDFYFDLEMSAFYSIVKITVEKYDWNASRYVSSYNVIVPGIVDTTDIIRYQSVKSSPYS